MGQVLGIIQDNLQGKEWKRAQLKKITDMVFERLKDDDGKVNLTFEELYIAVLLVYNYINKHLPGPHVDPPSKLHLKALIQKFDLNFDGELDHEEFTGFIQKLTSDMLSTVSHNLMITLVAAPTIALLTKGKTEGVPGVGMVVQKFPSSIYASIMTLAVMFLRKASGVKQIG